MTVQFIAYPGEAGFSGAYLRVRQGFVPTQEREHKAVIPAEERLLRYSLPEGFRIVSMAEECDPRKYNRVLWRGFDHPGEPPETDRNLEDLVGVQGA